jgi:hypothetical protein
MLIQNGVTAIASGGTASPKTMEILAEGAFCCQRVEDNAFHLFTD